MKRTLCLFLTLLTLLSAFPLSTFALSWDGSSAGGSTNAVNGSNTGYVIRSTNDSEAVVGYRFSVVNASGANKVSKVIDVFRKTTNGTNAYTSSAKFTTKYNKKQLIANKDGKMTTSKNTTNCYKEANLKFLTALPNPSGVETWQAYEQNINQVLTTLGVGTTDNMVYGDKVLIEPLFDVCLAGEYQALTVTEIAYCGRSVLGGSSDGGDTKGNSSTWGFISNYTNRIWPNKLFTPDGQGLWTAGSTIASSKRATFNVVLARGYGVGIAYNETQNLTYTIAFNGNGSTGGSTASMQMQYNETKQLNENGFVRTGHSFKNWNTLSNGNGTSYADKQSVKNLAVSGNSTVTLYAQWTPDTYTVHYDANGGNSAPNDQTKTYGVTLTLSSTKPTRTGYTFQSWNTKQDGSGTTYASGAVYTANAPLTLYAQWKINTYTVSYNANGGSGAPNDQIKTYGVVLTLSSAKPTRTGYTFQSWNTKQDGSGTTYAPGASYSANEPLTLYAQWKINTYMVSYNANGGAGAPNSQTKTYGINLTLSSVKPTRTGYTFKNWNTAANGSGTEYSDKQTVKNLSTTDGATITLYAQWVEGRLLRLEAIAPNVPYREGTDVISCFHLINEGTADCVPDDHVAVRFYVFEDNTIIKTVVLPDVVVPANEQNLLYFKWTVPTGLSDKLISIGGEIVENDTAYGAIRYAYTTTAYMVSSTPDTQYEASAPADFEAPEELPETYSDAKTWSIRTYEAAGFRKRDYGIGVANAPAQITPDLMANATQENGGWTMKSGYGITLSLDNGVRSLSGYTMPAFDAYTLPQYAEASFPEYGYLHGANQYRTLKPNGAVWRFRQNGSYGYVHFTPLQVRECESDYRKRISAKAFVDR